MKDLKPGEQATCYIKDRLMDMETQPFFFTGVCAYCDPENVLR